MSSSSEEFWEYLYKTMAANMRIGRPPDFEDSLKSALEVFLEVPRISDLETILDSNNLGEALRQARKARGLSMKVAAEKAEVSVSFLSDIERGAGNPSFRVLLQLTKVYKALLCLKIEAE